MWRGTAKAEQRLLSHSLGSECCVPGPASLSCGGDILVAIITLLENTVFSSLPGQNVIRSFTFRRDVSQLIQRYFYRPLVIIRVTFLLSHLFSGCSLTSLKVPS